MTDVGDDFRRHWEDMQDNIMVGLQGRSYRMCRPVQTRILPPPPLHKKIKKRIVLPVGINS